MNEARRFQVSFLAGDLKPYR